MSIMQKTKQYKEQSSRGNSDCDGAAVDVVATVNMSGNACPYALKMVACQLLLEVTTFLRETFQYLPKSKLPRSAGAWERQGSTSTRRWSSVLSSPGHSERSNSRSSQGESRSFKVAVVEGVVEQWKCFLIG